MNHTVFFLGMAALQVIFILYQYILFRRKEYIFYIVYSVLISLFVFFKSFPEANLVTWFSAPESGFTASRALLIMGYGMYFKFGRYFTEAHVFHKSIEQLLLVIERIFISFSMADVSLLLLGVPFQFFEVPTQILFLLSIPFCLYIIFYLIIRKRILTNIFVIGSGMLLLFGSAGFIDQTFITKGLHSPSYYLSYLEAGIGFEFLFLNYGLIYKTRMIQKESIRLEVERHVELYKQRIQISHDLHDEVGATLSGIALYSQLTKDQMKQEKPGLVEQSLDRMQQSAKEMVDKLSDIVWSVNPDQDSLEQLLQKLDDYAKEMAAVVGIEVQSGFDTVLPVTVLSMDTRRNTFLLLKEAINNVIKYSECTLLILHVTLTNYHLCFSIADDGIGFDAGIVRKGNGLNNMVHRAKELGAVLDICSSPGNGTQVSLTYNLPQ